MVLEPAERDEYADRVDSLSRELIATAKQRGITIAVAESLTGGLVSDAMVRTVGASEVFRGGIVAYVNDVKVSALGVNSDLLARCGAVTTEVAQQMALGVADRLGADVGLSTTGVAGPGAQDGIAPGTTVIAAVRPGGQSLVEELELTGTRTQVRRRCVLHALELALRVL